MKSTPHPTNTPKQRRAAQVAQVATLAATLIGTAVLPLSARAEAVRLGGWASLELRHFFQSPAFAGQQEDSQLSALLRPEWSWESDERDWQAAFVPFLRVDGGDDERSHADIRELWIRHIGRDWEITAGVTKVFWGVTESRHLVDIINQTDLVEDLDGEDKLGQPLIQLTTVNDAGTWSAFLLAGSRERSFPGAEGRFRAALPVDTDNSRYHGGAGRENPDLAARWSNYFGDWDMGLSAFHGTGREPRLLPNTTLTALEPHYDRITQFGLDAQFTRDGWLWKFEGIHREGQGEHFQAAVAGFEYSFYQVLETDADLGLLAEYLYDGRDASAPPTPFDDDLFLGARLTLNDAQSSSLLAGMVLDPDSGERFFSVEAERRLSPNLNLELRLRAVDNTQPGDALHGFARDDYLQLRINWFF